MAGLAPKPGGSHKCKMMKRKLIMQMRNEWCSNTWMMIELLVVGLVLWCIFLILSLMSSLHREPVAADYSDIYVGNLGYLGQNATYYKPYDDEHNYLTDFEMLAANLSTNPYVEIVGRGTNALPYNYNFSGRILTTTIDGKKEQYHCNLRSMTPEAVKAIRLHGLNGETPDELAEIIRRGELIVTSIEYDVESLHPERWRGKEAYFSRDDSSQVYKVGAVVDAIRRSDYEPSGGAVIQNEARQWSQQIIVRVKEGRGEEFMASLTGNDLEFGNVYVSNMQSLEDVKEACHREISTLRRNIIICAIFVLVSVFLGFLGSFWYRTQQRVPELALRKVNGATDAALFRRFISEGLLLLAIPMVLLVPTGIGFLGVLAYLTGDEGASIFELSINGYPAGQWLIWGSLAMAILSLAIMIVGGIWMPARKAMKIEPAIALKEQ